MKLIIAGGRDYQFTPQDYEYLEAIEGVTEVVSGCAKGADHCGELWAKWRDIPIKRFRPDWDGLGKAAGMLRNTAMAQYADALAIFPGGKGTENMYQTARLLKLTIYNYRDVIQLL